MMEDPRFKAMYEGAKLMLLVHGIGLIAVGITGMILIFKTLKTIN